MLTSILVDGGASANVMTYICLRIKRFSSINLNMANKTICKPNVWCQYNIMYIINILYILHIWSIYYYDINICINILEISTAVHLCGVRRRWIIPMILGRPWLTNTYVRNYRSKGLMTFSEDDDFADAMLMSIGIDNELT